MALGHLTLIARREKGKDAGWVVESPAVGRLIGLPRRGTLLDANTEAGILRVLRRDFQLVLPEACHGMVAEHLVEGKRPLVQYGQPLYRVGPALAFESEVRELAETEAGAEEEIPSGMTAVRSPTDGVFYRRPSPDAEPYVDEGSQVERGSVLALVEVMKCFNQITYGRDQEVPDKGRIHRVLPEDAQEVRYGQVLFIVEPG